MLGQLDTLAAAGCIPHQTSTTARKFTHGPIRPRQARRPPRPTRHPHAKIAETEAAAANEVDFSRVVTGAVVTFNYGKGEKATVLTGTVLGVNTPEKGAAQAKVAVGEGFKAEIQDDLPAVHHDRRVEPGRRPERPGDERDPGRGTPSLKSARRPRNGDASPWEQT
jgi:hypothetical protein